MTSPSDEPVDETEWIASGRWIASYSAGGCNCVGGGEWPHENYCGFEPLLMVDNEHNAARLVRDHNALIDELLRLRTEATS